MLDTGRFCHWSLRPWFSPVRVPLATPHQAPMAQGSPDLGGCRAGTDPFIKVLTSSISLCPSVEWGQQCAKGRIQLFPPTEPGVEELDLPTCQVSQHARIIALEKSDT